MALWVWTLKEPRRGQSEGLITPPHPTPFKEAWGELAAILPPFNLITLGTLGGGGRDYAINVTGALVIVGLAYLLIQQTGTTAQWVALGIGVYAAFSWSQALSLRDPATFAMIFKCRSVLLSVVGFPCIAFVGYGVGFWTPPFFQRVHEVSASEAGTVLGLSSAIGGWAGVTLGGVLADTLRNRTVRAKMYVGVLSTVLSLPLVIGLLYTDSLILAYVFNFLFAVTSPMWIGPAASTVNDLVMPRMRAVASAFYILMVTFIGLALGPYTIGQLSDSIAQTGVPSSEALRQGMLWGCSIYVAAFVLIAFALRTIESDETSRLSRAKALGEDVG